MPRWLTQVRLRLRSLFHGERVEQELREEMRYHLERLIEEGLGDGLSLDEARISARRRMGPITQNMEGCRDMRGLTFIEQRIQDLRFAARQLLKHPGFACTAILMLALGLAANVAIFGFADATLIKPLPYTDQSRLVAVFGTWREKTERSNLSYLDYVDLRARNRTVSSIDVYDVRTGNTLTTSTGAKRVTAPSVSAGFFHTLGITPILGRDFQQSDEGLSAPATVLLTYGTWQARFGGRADVLGQSLMLGGEPHTVVGVLPRDFYFALAGPAEFWLTIRGAGPCWQRRGCRSLHGLARLPDGVSPQIAAAGLDGVMQELREQYPDSNREQSVNVVRLREVILGDVQSILLVLLSGAGLLLLIACINVVTLLLVRSDSRARELALRNALGVSGVRLALQFATEALVLVGAGGTIGLALAAAGMRFLTSLLRADMVARLPSLQGIGLNVRLVAFAIGVSLVAAVVFALTPVVRASMSERFAGLKDGSRGTGTTWRRVGAYLVIAELAFAVILLVGAGLLGKSLYRLLRVDTGLNPDHLATLSVGLPPGNLRKDQSLIFTRQVAERVAAVPGVEAVGYADQLPLAPGDAPTSTFWVAGRPDREQLEDAHPVRGVSAGYFTALQARLLRGRYFTDAEVASGRHVMIINQSTAMRYFTGEDPIGQSISFSRPDAAEPLPVRQIVGVIADMKDGPVEMPARPAAYVPFDQAGGFALVVRTSRSEKSMFATLVTAIRELRPGLSISGQMTMTDRMDQLPSMHVHRSSAWIVGGFAAMAFLMSVGGLYGVIAYSVGQRSREIAVRMALGAQRRSVYQLILGQSAWLVAVGLALGSALAVGAAQLMRQLLFGVGAWDTPTLVMVAAVLAFSALLASWIPARRAASVNPIEVLRAD
jgi:macrolide transport system ATP-binding/permease protein